MRNFENQQIQSLIEHSELSIKIGKELISSAQKLLFKVDQKLQKLDLKDITPQLVPAYLRATVNTYQMGLIAIGDGLGVEEILRVIRNDGFKPKQ